MKLVVITGCLGFIGSHITELCLKKGWKVFGIDSETYAANVKLKDHFKSLYGDNFEYLNKKIEKLNYLPDCDYVINTAAETHVGNSIIDSDSFIVSNVLGVQNLLKLIKQKPNNTFRRPILFHISTDEVYGDIEEGSHNEKTLLNPSNPYSSSKAAADLLITSWARTYGIEYVILRPTNNYGIYQYPEKLIPLSVRALDRGKKIRLHNNGEPIRNWLHVQDTASSVIFLIENGSVNEIYNISGGFEQKNSETVRKIIQAYYGTSRNWKDYIEIGWSRPGQDVRYSLDDSKLKSLGWDTKKTFDLEIKIIVDHYKKNFRW